MAGSTYLESSFTGTGNASGAKSTHSFWVKRSNDDNNSNARSTLIAAGTSGNYMKFRFGDNDRLHLYGVHSSSNNISIETRRQFKDVFAWYNIVLQIDTTHATSSERIKIFVNGVQETDLTVSTYPSQNAKNYLTADDSLQIGGNGNTEHFDGLMTHVHGIDGTIEPPSKFGETDATTGEWKIITGPSVTYGTKGYCILKDGITVTDQSSNSNNFTVAAGTLTKTEDCPSNIFATLNTLNQSNGSATFANGNTTLTVSGNWLGAISTLGVYKGKWYFEIMADGNNFGMGVCHQGRRTSRINELSTGNAGYLGKYNDGWSFYENGNNPYKLTNDSTTSYGENFGSGDIGMFALDADNGKIWAGRNGTWFASGDPANGTNAMFDSLDNSYGWHVGVFGENSTVKCNFGNGYFGTTAVSSAGTNASNIGIFEHNVPAGFTALSTKGLNE